MNKPFEVTTAIFLWLIVVSALVFVYKETEKPKPQATDNWTPSNCFVVHTHNGQCPIDYHQSETRLFHEADGSTEYTCMSNNYKQEICIDLLKPGEWIALDWPVENRQQ